ncbi:hypothetical protein AB1Y20_010570 [Prymnesium parvum]|uniref:Nucleotide-diphospho-sugar transferase domain-containing protein n=1 Tax=Prymnesium parvum TaxID=97485 RepID=A0AB34IRV8_PRYPA
MACEITACGECFRKTGGASPIARAKVAIASVWDGGKSYECAIPLWCQSATRISRVIRSSELLLLTPKRTSHCAHAVQLFAQHTDGAAQAYLSRIGGRGLLQGFSTANLLKFALFSLTRYELLLYADLDIDLAFPRMLTAAAWDEATAALLATKALFVGLFDHASPVNGGLWLARPRCWLYAEAMRVLRHGTWSAKRGFDSIGTPHQIGANRTWLRPVLDAIAAGSGASLFKVEGTLNYTQYFRWNRWDFVNGHLDQGMLWYLFFVRNTVGTWSHYVGPLRGKWAVDHFWGSPKPWQGDSSHTSRNYWHRLDSEYQPVQDLFNAQTEQRCTRQKPPSRESGSRGSGWKTVVGPLPHPQQIRHFGSTGFAVERLPSD